MTRVVGKNLLSSVSLAFLIGLFGLEAASPPHREAKRRDSPSGPVGAEGHAVADARGPFNALGATLFWGAWGYKFDRSRLERNLAVLSDAGFDYVRVLGSVGGASWKDRETDPRWDDYDAVIAGMTDLVYDRYGMRVQWTLFGGAPSTPPGAERKSLVDRFAALARGREHKIFAFEIANEARSNGFHGSEGVAELRELGKRLSERTPVLVALSAPNAAGACETYAGAGADVATMHYDRGFGSDGPVRPLLRPWDYPAAYDAECRGQLPPVVFNNEPIGPESSVEEDANVPRIAAGYVMTFLANNAAYVLHAGPGIRGGGAADLAPPTSRHANFDELPSFKPITAALASVRTYLPAGLANWTRREAADAATPIQGFEAALKAGTIAGAYTATSGSNFVSLVMGIRKPFTVRVRTASSIDIRRAASADVLRTVDVAAGGSFSVRGGETLVLVGRHRRK